MIHLRPILASLTLSFVGWAVVLPPSCLAQQPEQDWPMLAHDPARSGATTAEIRPPFQRKWYRLFADEGLMAGVQAVVASDTVYIGTMAGILHAIDDETGRDRWAFHAGGPILHACGAAGGKVFFGCADGKVYAVNASDGKLLWSVQTGAAVWNAPLVHNGLVLIASRDGKLYAIGADTGQTQWTAATGGPILASSAVDTKANRVYVASEDMRVYAFDLRDGRQLWISEKLPGVTFRGYHPVIAPDGSVMVTVAPCVSGEVFPNIMLDMVKAIFGDFASWRHTKEENERLREENFKRMEQPGTYEAQLAYLRQRLAEQPAYQTFFVLHPDTGQQKFVAPIVYGESMNGVEAPPLVTPDGKVIVKYQALLRSRYQHYSPFLNVGYLDTETGHITPLMDQTRTYGWHDSLLLVHDEQCQLSVAGRVLINAHQDNVNAMDLDTLVGYGEPFCRNIHEPQPDEAVSIWAHILRGLPLPAGKEWLARGTAVYGGGSVIDAAVSIAGDNFYYIPTHEINSGCALIAYHMQPGVTAAQPAKPAILKLTNDEWQKVQELPWDWDLLEMPRLTHVLKSLPGSVPGTRKQPLTEQTGASVAAIPDAELDRFIWETAVPQALSPGAAAHLKAHLTQSVAELISQEWEPFVFPAGKHPVEAYRIFTEPTEVLYTLARAYDYLEPDMKQRVQGYVARMSADGGPLTGPTGQRTFRPGVGAVRSLYDPPAEELLRLQEDITRSEVARLYPIWLWAHKTGDWSKIETEWSRLRELVSREPNDVNEDCRNGYVAGLVAYCRIAAHMKDQAVVEHGVGAARKAIRERLLYEFAHPRGGLITQVPVLRTVLSRWKHLTPEVGRLCAAYAKPAHAHLMDVYVDYHRPTWWLAWNVETLWRNECPFQFPSVAAEVLAARALILREPADQLEQFLDIPWCRADLYYIQKLVLCIEAHGEVSWRDVRQIG